jgi:hypothetical protein
MLQDGLPNDFTDTIRCTDPVFEGWIRAGPDWTAAAETKHSSHIHHSIITQITETVGSLFHGLDMNKSQSYLDFCPSWIHFGYQLFVHVDIILFPVIASPSTQS